MSCFTSSCLRFICTDASLRASKHCHILAKCFGFMIARNCAWMQTTTCCKRCKADLTYHEMLRCAASTCASPKHNAWRLMKQDRLLRRCLCMCQRWPPKRCGLQETITRGDVNESLAPSCSFTYILD